MITRSTLAFFTTGTLALCALHCGGESPGTPGGGGSTSSSAGDATSTGGSGGSTPVDPCAAAPLKAPAAPSALAVESVSSYEVTLTWTPSPDPAVKHYRVLRGAAQVGLVDKPHFAHRPVVPGEVYSYTITALGGEGGESAPTSAVEVTIPAVVKGPIESLAPGSWYEVPGSYLADFALTASDYPWLGMGEGIGGLMNDWSSGALDTQRDRLYVGGGGHNGYFGNEIYSFDLRTMAWGRLTDPDPLASAGAECPDKALGVPCATHTYDGLEYLPPPFDRFLVVGWDGWPQTTLDLDTNRWEAHPDLPQLGARTGATCAYDPLTRVLWYHAGGGALSYWDPATGLWTIRGSSESQAYYRNAVVDPHRRLYVGVGMGHTVAWTIDALGKFVPVGAELATTGDREIEDVGNPGVEYDPVNDRLVAWKGGGDVYTLDLDQLVWTRHPVVGEVVATPGNINGTYGRFRYVPSLNVFVVVSGAHENVFVYRLDAEAPHLMRRVDVTSASATIEANLTTKLAVAAVYRDGASIDVTADTTYSSLDPLVATVDAAGVVHAHAPGHARIQANHADPLTRLGMVGALDLEVVPLAGEVVLDSVAIEPSAALAVAKGRSLGLSALAGYHRGADSFLRDVTCEATWSADDGAIAAVSGASLDGIAVGSTVVHARLGTMDTKASLAVLENAAAQLIALNFQPAEPALVKGWAVADDAPFDAARGWGWDGATDLATRDDRSGVNDLRLGSFVVTNKGAKFHVQVPDGRYHVAAGLGDNTFGAGLHSLEIAGVGVVYNVGGGNTAGAAIVEATGGAGLVFDVVGPINWMAVMPVNGMSFASVLAEAKTW
jgi:Big-like domain-containing protein